MHNKTVAEATADLVHTVANMLTLLEAAINIPGFLTPTELATYSRNKAPELRAALAAFKEAQIRADADLEPWALEHIRDRDCERYHQDKDDRLADAP